MLVLCRGAGLRLVRKKQFYEKVKRAESVSSFTLALAADDCVLTYRTIFLVDVKR